MGSLNSADALRLALAIVCTVCSILFAVVGWLVRMELKRAVTQYTDIAVELRQQAKEFAEFREWTRFIFGIAGIIDSSGIATGRRIRKQ